MRSRNLCCSEKATSIKYYLCVCVCVLALVIRYQIECSLHCIILSSVACMHLQYLSTLSHKRQDFGKKIIEHKIHMNFLCSICVKYFYSKKK